MSPLKLYFPLQTLKPGYGPVQAYPKIGRIINLLGKCFSEIWKSWYSVEVKQFLPKIFGILTRLECQRLENQRETCARLKWNIALHLQSLVLFHRFYFSKNSFFKTHAKECTKWMLWFGVFIWMDTLQSFPQAFGHFIKHLNVSPGNPGVVLRDNHTGRICVQASNTDKDNGLVFRLFLPLQS